MILGRGTECRLRRAYAVGERVIAAGCRGQINPEPTGLDCHARFMLQCRTGEILPSLPDTVRRGRT